MYFIPYLFSLVYIFIRCIDFSSWLGLACIVLFLILTVHSYVVPTLNKFIYLFILFINFYYKGCAFTWSLNNLQLCKGDLTACAFFKPLKKILPLNSASHNDAYAGGQERQLPPLSSVMRGRRGKNCPSY